jgi:hypothetical protein
MSDDLLAEAWRILDEETVNRNGDHPADDHDEEVLPPPVLPDEFWDARETLKRIRTAARSRGAAPDAVLGAVLAGVSLRTHPDVKLPPIVGGPGSLNLAVGIIGPSGTGKGVAMRTAADLLPELVGRVGIGPPGTGQGMLDAYFEAEKDENGKIVDHVQRLDGFMFEADEGQVVSKLGEGTGSLTLEVMRHSFNGERCGTTTVGAPWRISVRTRTGWSGSSDSSLRSLVPSWRTPLGARRNGSCGAAQSTPTPRSTAPPTPRGSDSPNSTPRFAWLPPCRPRSNCGASRC